MSGQARPWWATTPDEAPAGGRSPRTDADEVLRRHRAARMGGADGAEPETAGQPGMAGRPGMADRPAAAAHEDPDPSATGPDPQAGGADDATATDATSTTDHVAALCGVCPICVLARAVGDSRPELLEHLGRAAHHLGAALRSLADPSPNRTPADERIERIDLDPR